MWFTPRKSGLKPNYGSFTGDLEGRKDRCGGLPLPLSPFLAAALPSLVVLPAPGNKRTQLTNCHPNPTTRAAPRRSLPPLSRSWQHLAGDVDSPDGRSAHVKVNTDMGLFVTELSAGKSVPYAVRPGRKAYVVCLEGSAGLRGGKDGAPGGRL